MIFDPNASLIKTYIAKTFPKRAIKYGIKNRMAGAKSDLGNFQSADELRSLLLAYDMISFDYFDTLASRNISLPAIQDMTARYGAILAGAVCPELRRNALRHSRSWFAETLKHHYMSLSNDGFRNEVALDDLFDRVLKDYVPEQGLRTSLVDKIVRYETALECLVLQPHPDFIALIRFLKASGKTVILTSDMYLSRDAIIQVLKHQGIHDLFDRVYVSSTSRVTKHSGALFKQIDQQSTFSGKSRFHVGDNYNNDCVQPRKNGWSALHFFQPDYEATRQKLDLEYRFGQTSEDARFQTFQNAYCRGGIPSSLRMLSATFAIFVRRLIERAHMRQVDALYFLTRDGTIFHDIAQAFLDSPHGQGLLEGTNVEIMAVNRRSGVLLEYPGLDDLGWLTFNVSYLKDSPVSLRTIMKTFAVTVDDLGQLSPRDMRLVKRCLQTRQVMDLSMENLAKRPQIRQALDQALQHKKEQARSYLKQKGLLDPKKSILLVDIGYSGTALKSISRLLFQEQVAPGSAEARDVGARVELSMFAGNRFLGNNLGQMHPKCHLDDGVIINSETAGGRALGINFSWLEPLCLDRSLGTLQGYRADDAGLLEPVFNPAVEDPDFIALRRDILRSAQEYFDLSVQSNIDLDRLDDRMTEAMIDTFVKPSRQTVAMVKTHLHHVGNADSEYTSPVRKISLRHLVRDISQVLAADQWAQGSLRESGLSILTPALNHFLSKALK